ncbi:MAG: helix-turn-helix domain-containing protein, partial [Caulobacteraceae bacterium]
MIGEALRLIRVFHGLKQNQIAERVGLSTSYVSEIERGQRTPTLETVERYARVFEMPASSIMFFAESINSPQKA